MIERLQHSSDPDLLDRERADEDLIHPTHLPNLFMRVNGFKMALNLVAALRETYNTSIEGVKARSDSGLP
jgi:autonomous glycyl radical cofactor GrcA